MYLLGIEDVESLNDRCRKRQVGPEIRELADDASNET